GDRRAVVLQRLPRLPGPHAPSPVRGAGGPHHRGGHQLHGELGAPPPQRHRFRGLPHEGVPQPAPRRQRGLRPPRPLPRQPPRHRRPASLDPGALL
ncbi:MAG: hypothetical protein AVDCRST_MAG68-2936, partial [uncultured Gemmatimonadetes bacterium]